MLAENIDLTKCSFAAANGYTGFRSYFDSFFAPNKYNSIYILKGGPGTGKSTLMKKMANNVALCCDDYELILCSSDAKSLDGVVFQKNDKKIAIIDGTAPHSVDPIYPGAVEEIVNLGVCWSTESLKCYTKEIKAISSQKKRAYETAYEYMRHAGSLHNSVFNIIEKAYSLADDAQISLANIESIPSQKNNKIRLFSSYGKNGFYSLPNAFEGKKIYSVVGVYGSEYIFMSHLKRALDAKGIKYTESPSPLSNDLTDTISIRGSDCIYSVERSRNSEQVIDTCSFLDQNMMAYERSRLEFLWKEREIMLWAASDEFKKASDAHFELEKIYSSSMDFDMLDNIYDEVKLRILKEINSADPVDK